MLQDVVAGTSGYKARQRRFRITRVRVCLKRSVPCGQLNSLLYAGTGERYGRTRGDFADNAVVLRVVSGLNLGGAMIPPVSSPIPAAQYQRKSEGQRYCIDNQKAAT